MKSKKFKTTAVYCNDKGEPMIVLSQCPGKNFKVKGKQKFERNLSEDLALLKDSGVKVIVNLLNLYELRTIGVSLIEYRKVCEKIGIELIEYPIIEMSVPIDPIEQIDKNMLDGLTDSVKAGKKVLIHCRGGVGRAGLMAALLLFRLEKYKDYDSCLTYLRKTRHNNCVESMKQRDYMRQYYKQDKTV